MLNDKKKSFLGARNNKLDRYLSNSKMFYSDKSMSRSENAALQDIGNKLCKDAKDRKQQSRINKQNKKKSANGKVYFSYLN